VHTYLLSSETLVFSSKARCQEFFFSGGFLEKSTGPVLDFGVASGGSTLQIAEGLLLQPERLVYGFDAFEGIRDAWSKPDRTPGSMDLDGIVPAKLRVHPKTEMVVGWVEDTLPKFLAQHGSPIEFVHFDMDVFGPTRFALEEIRPRLNSGAVLMFDDYFGFIGWQNHSHRALNEVLDRGEYDCIGISPTQAVFRLK